MKDIFEKKDKSENENTIKEEDLSESENIFDKEDISENENIFENEYKTMKDQPSSKMYIKLFR